MSEDMNLPVTTADLKAELARFATKADLESELARFATKAELESELARFATKAELKAEMARFATKDDLDDLKSVIRGFAISVDKRFLQVETSFVEIKDAMRALSSSLHQTVERAMSKSTKVETDQVIVIDRLDDLDRRVTKLERKDS